MQLDRIRSGRSLRSKFAILALGLAGASLAHAANDPPGSRQLQAAQAQAERGDRASALKLLAQALATNPQLRSARLLQLYLLTDSARFDEGRAAAEQITSLYPKDAGAWLAAAYAFRHGGDVTRALVAYRTAAQLEPGNSDAFLGQVLMLSQAGAVDAALQLAQSRPQQVPTEVMNQLKQDQAAVLLRMARAGGSLAERKGRIDRAMDLLGQIDQRSAGVRADQLVAMHLQGQHAQVVAAYDRDFDVQSAPFWATDTAAASLMELGQPARAKALFEALLQKNPNNFDWQAGLFYALSDLGEFAQARTLADRMVEQSAAGAPTADRIEDALVLQIFSRAWAGDTKGALFLGEAASRRFPESAQILDANAWVRLWAGDRAGARLAFEHLLRKHPGHFDGQLGLIALDQGQERLPEANRKLEQLIETTGEIVPRLSRAQRTQRELEGAWVWAQASFVREQLARGHRLDLEAASPLLGGRNVRVLGSVTHMGNERAGTSLNQTYVGAGVMLGDADSRVTIKAHTPVLGSGHTGASLGWSGTVTDRVSAQARISKNDLDLPVTARAAGVRGDSAEAGVTWQGAGVAAGSNLKLTKFSDDNRSTSLSAWGRQDFALTPGLTLQGMARLGVSQSSKQNVAYFSPRAAWWAEIEPKFNLLSRVQEGTSSVRWWAAPVAGLFGQEAHGIKPYGGVGLGMAYEVSRTTSVSVQASTTRRPYDGKYETRHEASANVFMRLP